MTLLRVEVEAAAKVNLGWRVGTRRDDGFHEVDGEIQTISLTDRLEFISGEPGFEVPGHPELATDDNLVLIASRAIAEQVSVAPGVRIVLHKSIPIAAGLGGGSADAAAALVGLNALWKAGLTAKRLVEIGATIGSDVPPILVGGRVHVSGRGEKVRSVDAADDRWFVIGEGAEHVSASDAYDAFDRIGPGERTDEMHNDLEAAACSLVPGLAERVEAMGAETDAAFVSGSGPTVIGVVRDRERADAPL
jgi:4-diphosphocytidyl-2-C-methyl-D-erythritol kinase